MIVFIVHNTAVLNRAGEKPLLQTPAAASVLMVILIQNTPLPVE